MSEKMSIEEYKEKMEELFDECEKVLAQIKRDTLVELKESKKEKWKPKDGEKFWFRNFRGMNESYIHEDFFSTDEWIINNLPIFKTEEACERYWHFMDAVKEKSYEFTELEWKNGEIEKLYITYNYTDGVLYIDNTWYYRDLGKIYFKTEEDAQYIIDNFKDELMEYFV